MSIEKYQEDLSHHQRVMGCSNCRFYNVNQEDPDDYCKYPNSVSSNSMLKSNQCGVRIAK